MTGYRLIDGFIVPTSFVCPKTQSASSDRDAHLDDQHPGRPRLSGEPNSNLSFKCPESNAQMIAYAAKISGTKKSTFMRDAALEKAARVISMHQARESDSR